MSRRPLVVKQWSVNFDSYKEVLKVYPIWIQLQGLPFGCWSSDSFSRVSSEVGKSIFANDCTSRQKRLPYAIVLVEADVTGPLVENVVVDAWGGYRFSQTIKYEYKPKFCETCKKLGHKCKDGVRMVKKWVPKAPFTAKVVSDAGVITPTVTVEEAKSGDEGGWVAATKVARRSILKPVMVSGPSRGLKVLVRDEGASRAWP